ncbi:MAG TPA: alpha/beta hydrolase [Chloroflexota bacterium]|nr:alpha/beta hydrolase [Chloroflexota bacterium]
MAEAAKAVEAHADLPGVRLWYRDTGGSGAPVILMHANTGNSDSWGPNIPALVGAGYRAIAFDRRGWGRSVAQPESGPQPGTIADDLHGLVDHLRLVTFHLVGIAGGGYAAYDYAIGHPERLRSLVVAASGGGIPESDYAREYGRVRLPGFPDWPAQFREVSLDYLATNPTGLQAWLEIHGRSRQPGAPAQPTRNSITLKRLETLRIRTLLIAADNDLTTPPYVMRMQAGHLPDARFLLIPDAGHSVNWEQPAAFNDALLEFLGRG